jgi:cobalamin synthase
MSNVEPVHSNDSGDRTRLPQLRDLRAALGLLTVLPFDRPGIRSAAAARATICFPLVGGLIGLLLTGTNWVIGDRLAAAVSAIVLVGFWEAISGGAALRACGGMPVNTRRTDHPGRCPGLMASRTFRAESKQIRTREDSSPNGATLHEPGASPRVETAWTDRILIAALLVIKIVLLARYAASRPAALLFAPMLARWAMVVLAVGARDAAAPSRKLNPAITFREFAFTSVFTCAVVFTVAEAFGILLVVGVAALTLVLRLLRHRRPGGTSWPLLLASAELVELLVLGIVGVVGRR